MIGVLAVLCCSAMTQDQPRQPIHIIDHAGATAVAWSPDGSILAVGDPNGIQLYTVDFEPLTFLEQPSSQMKFIKWSPDGTLLAAYGTNDIDVERDPSQLTVYVWDVANEIVIRQFDEHKYYVTDAVWSSDGEHIATVSFDETIRVWSVFDPSIYFLADADDLSEITNVITDVDWAGDGTIIAYMSGIGVYGWRDRFGFEQIVPGYLGNPQGSPKMSRLNPINNDILLGNGIYIADTITTRYFENCGFQEVWQPNGLLTVGFVHDTNIICDPYNDIVIASLENGTPNGLLEMLVAPQTIDWNPDGKLIAGTNLDDKVRIWDVSDIVSNQPHGQ
jgi:WD40 repeat protein